MCIVWHAFCTFIQDVRGRNNLYGGTTKIVRKRANIQILRDNMPASNTRFEKVSVKHVKKGDKVSKREPTGELTYGKWISKSPVRLDN